MRMSYSITFVAALLGGTTCLVVAYRARANDFAIDIPAPTSTWGSGGPAAVDPADQYVVGGITQAAPAATPRTAAPRRDAPPAAVPPADEASGFPYWTLEPIGAAASLTVLTLIVLWYRRSGKKQPEPEVYAIEFHRQRRPDRRAAEIDALLNSAERARSRRKAA